jgi:hypothetical protein
VFCSKSREYEKRCKLTDLSAEMIYLLEQMMYTMVGIGATVVFGKCFCGKVVV